MLQNGTGFELADADAFNMLDVEIEGYQRGLAFIQAKAAASTGDLVNVRVRDCETAVEAVSIQGSVRMTACEFLGTRHGVRLAPEFGGPMMLLTSHCRFSSIQDDSRGGGGLVQCVGARIDGPVAVQRVAAGFIGCWFGEKASLGIAGTAGKTLLVGNRGLKSRAGTATLQSDEPVPLTAPPVLKLNAPLTPKPARTRLFRVTDDIQAKLDEAGRSGGGIVFLPAGTYRVRQSLVVPAGVALRGPLDFWQRRVGRLVEHLGATLEIEFGAGSTDGPAAIELSPRSGVRGVMLHWPQDAKALKPYPWAVRGRGEGVWVISTMLVNPHAGIDFAAHRCDRFMTDMVLMNPFRRGIAVGSGSTGGFIQNTHMNSAFWAHGFWDDSPPAAGVGDGIVLDEHISQQLVAYDFNGCRDTRLFSCFTHGAKHLYHLRDAELAVLLAGAESTVEAVVAESLGPRGVSLVNFHVLPTKGHHRVPFTLRPTLAADVAVRGWNTLCAGYPAVFADVQGGHLAFELLWEANFRTASPVRTSGSGRISLHGSFTTETLIAEGDGITASANRFAGVIDLKSSHSFGESAALCLLRNPPDPRGLRLLGKTTYAPQVCSPGQVDVLLPARIAAEGVMDFAPVAPLAGAHEFIVNWHDGAPKGRRVFLEQVTGDRTESLATITTTGSRRWLSRSVNVDLAPSSRLRLRFENNAAVSISQVELRKP